MASNGIDCELQSSSTQKSGNAVRSRNGRLSRIVVIEVNQKNLNAIWPYLLISIKEASFISIDLELSGLGDRKGWGSSNLEERYRAIRKGAQTRSIVSLGITTFKLLKRKETPRKKRIKYKCQVFNILTLLAAPFVVEPDGLKFLVDNGFDLNRLTKVGVPYFDFRATNKESALRLLWRKILERNVPLTFHNGIVDLIFLYQHLYAELPEELPEFITNISDWFIESSSNVFDSKYFAEYYTRMKGSFLEYVFRKCQRDNAVEASCARLYISIEFDNAVFGVVTFANAVDIVDCDLPEGFYAANIQVNVPNSIEKMAMCPKYSAYGFCGMKGNCQLLHNVDAVLDVEEEKQNRLRLRRKRRYDFASKGIRLKEDEETQSCSDHENVEKPDGHLTSEASDEGSLVENCYRNQQPYLKRAEIGCHRAGVDSFITGFAVAFMSRMSLLRNGVFDPVCGNRIPMPGKTVPLIIRRYEHTNKTEDHLAIWENIHTERVRAKQPILT